jgi:hypothetical protein
MIAALAPINSRLSRDIRPPRRAKTYADFAATMRLPDGPSAGNHWVLASEPTQAAFADVVDSGEYRCFVVVAPSQRGKTLKGVIAPALLAICESRQSVGYVMPNLDKLTQNYEGKIKPAIEGTGFGGWLPTKGPGSKGGKPAVLTMRDPGNGLVAGRIYFMATGTGGRETSVSSVSPQTVVYDEGDDAESAGQLDLVFRRVQAYGVAGRCYIVSTVNDRRGREDHPILELHARGTQHRMHHRCPHCRAYVLPSFEHLNLDDNCIFCPSCAVHWTDDERHDALNQGVWCAQGQIPMDGRATGIRPPNEIYSELTTGLDYHMAVIPDICSDIRAARASEARGDYSIMRTVMHKVFCRHYEEPAAPGEITPAGLFAVSLRSDYDKRICPQWVTHLSAAVDVQGNRLYWGVIGHGPDSRWCLVDWGYEMLVPVGVERKETPADRRAALDAIDIRFNDGWQRIGSDERISPLAGLRGVDVGFLTDEIMAWMRGMPGWRACRGASRDTLKVSGTQVELPPEARAFVDVRRPAGWPIICVNVIGDNMRRWIHAGFLRDPYTPASGMLPRGLKLSDYVFKHLSGEVERTDKDGVTKFYEITPRHDILDVIIYAHGLNRLRTGVQTVAARKPGRKYGNIGDVR